ncbi:MAG: glycosyltransferase family 2 protein [Candidatus Dormibacteraeota bacterium]|nr:glycosyltransferase family 2 protein [Candidatus Dormibacteraeota bacterium]
MYRDQRIGVVVPAYNEERQIELVLGTMPDFVDSIIVVDDLSTDATAARTEAWRERLGDRLTLIRHQANVGVGGAITSGHRKALEQDLDIVVVMAGDGQMDPSELRAIIEPLVSGKADFSKGNRLFSGRAWEKTPKVRYLGNAMLSMMTKFASGYWHVADSQAGYTAISKPALASLDLDRLHPRYAFENSILIQLNIRNWRVQDVAIEPRYGIGEKSSMRILTVIPDISWLLFRGFLDRMFEKYVIRDFHPLVFFYGIGALLLVMGFALGIVEIALRVANGQVASATVVLVALLMISGLQLLLFGMWFDMEYNRTAR